MLKKSKKNKKNSKIPVRALLWICSFLFLTTFLLMLPIYKNVKMTSLQHLQHGLVALQNSKYAKAKTHLLHVAQNQDIHASAEQKARAFFALGSMEIEGKNINSKANPKEAAFYFEKAASLGFKDAQYMLALLYDRGEGVDQNKEKALYWGLLSAAQGDINASYAVAVWLERGYNGQAEPYQALKLYEYAASKGHRNAIISLISIYSGGTDIPKDVRKADYWKKQLDKTKDRTTYKK